MCGETKKREAMRSFLRKGASTTNELEHYWHFRAVGGGGGYLYHLCCHDSSNKSQVKPRDPTS